MWTTLSQGGGDDAGQPTQPLTPTTTSGPMTRSRAKAIHDKVNSLLYLHTFDVSVNGSLPHGDTLCMLSYEPSMEPQGDAKDDQDKGQEEEEEEEATRRRGAYGSRSGTTAASTAPSTATPKILADAPAVPSRYRPSTTAGKWIDAKNLSRHRYYRQVHRYYRHLPGRGTTAGPGGTTAACVQKTGIFPCIPSFPTPFVPFSINRPLRSDLGFGQN